MAYFCAKIVVYNYKAIINRAAMFNVIKKGGGDERIILQ